MDRALRKRGELDGIPELMRFADLLEKASIDTVESGVMTKDLALLSTLENKKTVTYKEFMAEIRKNLEEALASC